MGKKKEVASEDGYRLSRKISNVNYNDDRDFVEIKGDLLFVEEHNFELEDNFGYAERSVKSVIKKNEGA